MKKTLFIVSLLVVLCSCGSSNFGVPGDIGVSNPSVPVTEVQSDAKDITSFSVVDQTGNTRIGIIDEAMATVAIPVWPGTYIPTIVITGVSVSPSSGVVQDFTNPVTYTVTAEDGTTKDYIVMMTLTPPPPPTPCTPYAFADPNLDEAVRVDVEINKPLPATLCKEDLVNLHTLDASGLNISNISGLELCVNLTSLSLANNGNITSISNLSGLINLAYLNIASLHLDDFEPLMYLTSLKAAVLSKTGMDNFSFGYVSALEELELLDVSDNNISDIAPIGSLTQLKHFYAGNNMINSITDLAPLTKLQEVNLEGNQISDISALDISIHNGSFSDAAAFIRLGGNPAAIIPMAKHIALAHSVDITW